MKRICAVLMSTMFIVAVSSGAALAIKPGEDVNPNGFLSGPHYNLNIHGKKENFTCPDQTTDDGGKSVFIPLVDSGVSILMQSGKKGGKADLITDLQVIDRCAMDDGQVVFQLPPGKHRVFARALATPTGEPDMMVIPSLERVEDSMGNELIDLGLVTDNGFMKPNETFTRSTGKSKAVEVSELFMWSGSVCYLDAADCPAGGCNAGAMDLCCIPDGLGGYDSCGFYGDGCEDGGGVLVTASCNEYTEEWVFNIGELVDYLWTTSNNGLRLLQLRFYPVD